MKKLNLDEEKVIELYHKLKSSNKVAKEFGCSVNPILCVLNNHKIKRYGFLGAFGKDNGMYGRKHSPEARELSKIARAKQNGINHPMYGKHHSEESKKNISLGRKGKLCGKDNPMYGIKRTEEMAMKCLLTKIKNNSLPKGEKNPMWNGGIMYEPYTSDFNKKFKSFIRKRDNYICMVCGVHKEKLTRALDIHHINYDKTLSIPQNCVSLCLNCHGKTHYNRKHWIQFFQSILSEKYGYKHEDKRIVVEVNK